MGHRTPAGDPTEGGKAAVYAALVANCGIAVTKFGAA